MFWKRLMFWKKKQAEAAPPGAEPAEAKAEVASPEETAETKAKPPKRKPRAS